MEFLILTRWATQAPMEAFVGLEPAGMLDKEEQALLLSAATTVDLYEVVDLSGVA